MILGYLPNEPRFLAVDEVLTLHETGVDAFGGSHGLRDSGLLDSALAMPRQALQGAFVHEVPFGMASAYLFHICLNHPFVDGNNRVALAACITFLRLNGWNLTATEESAYSKVIAVAEGSATKEAIAEWIMGHVRPRPTLELRDFLQRLDYITLASIFGAIAAGPTPERVATIVEAGHAIPAIAQANAGAVSVEEGGDLASAEVLRQHSMLLTAVYRIAEDMGYEW